MVAEDEVGGELRANRRRVRLDPAVELGSSAVLQELDLVARVAIEDEDGKKPADVRPDRLGAAEVVELGTRLLAEDGDVVPCPHPLSGELPRVDVRPRTAEQVPVPEQNAHS